MNRTKFRPTYSLDEAKSLACSGEMVVNGKVRRHLINHYGYLDIDRFLADLFDYLKPSDFRKSIALDMDGPLHDVYADVYVCRDFECEDWYVKFSIDSEGKEMQFTTAPMTEIYRGEKITVEGIGHYICKCGNDEMTAAEATKLAHALAAQYAKAHELLSPSEIKHLRSDLGLTQHEFESLLGVSKPTSSRWENGASQQTVTANILMRLIRDVPEAREYLGLALHERTATLSSPLLSVIPGGKAPAYRDSDPLVDENSFRLEM